MAPRPRPEEPPPPPQFYLIGTWAEAGGGSALLLDPARWCLSGTGVLASTARQRYEALVQRDAALRGAQQQGSTAGFTPGVPMRPAVWRGADGAAPGLSDRERRWVAAATPPSRSLADMQQGDPHLLATAAWMRAAKRPRQHPLDRQQERREEAGQRQAEEQQRRQEQLEALERVRHQRQQQWQQQQQQQQPQPPAPSEPPQQGQLRGQAPPARRGGPRPPRAWWDAFDDARHGRAPGGSPPWGAAWRRLRRVHAPRTHRHLMWRVMHGSLPVAARLVAQERRGVHDHRCRSWRAGGA